MKPEECREWDEVILTGTSTNGKRYVDFAGVIGCHPNSDPGREPCLKLWPWDDEEDGKIWFDFKDIETITRTPNSYASKRRETVPPPVYGTWIGWYSPSGQKVPRNPPNQHWDMLLVTKDGEPPPVSDGIAVARFKDTTKIGAMCSLEEFMGHYIPPEPPK